MADIQHIEPGVTDAADSAARVNAAIDRVNVPKEFYPANRNVAFFGDSRVNQGSGADGWRNMGFISWLRFLTGQRFNVKYDTSLGAYTSQPADGTGTPSPVHDNYGVTGNQTDQMLSRCDKMLAATDAGTFIILGGMNDRLNAKTLNESKSNITAILDKMEAAGRIAIIIAELPSGDSSTPAMRIAVPQRQYHLAYRQWLLSLRDRRGVFVVDCWDLFTDRTTTDQSLSDAKIGKTYDGRHPSMRGAYDIALKLQPVIERLFTPVAIMPASNGDRFDAVSNPLGALNSNPMMAGTGGSLGTNCTGTLAASWQASGGSGSTGSNAAYGKGTSPEGNPYQHLAVTGTPTGAEGTCNYNLLRTISQHAQLAPGDIIEGLVDIIVKEGSSGFLSLSLRIDVTVDGVNYSIGDGMQRLTGNYIPEGSFAGILRTPRYQIPTGASLTAATLTLQGFMAPNVVAALDLSCNSMVIRKA